jgi:hypothetical protein
MIKVYYRRRRINILLYNNGAITGILRVSRRWGRQGVLDLFIRPRYRCKWLNKELYFNLRAMFIAVCAHFGYNMIITRLNNIKSLRLLNHFGFSMYNEEHYYLRIY